MAPAHRRPKYPPRSMSPSADPGRVIDSPAAWWRLVATLAIATLGGVGMWSVVVALPAVQADFGVDRGSASLPYTLTMVGFGLGGILMGRLSDRYGVTRPLFGATLALATGYVAGRPGADSLHVCAGAGTADRVPRQLGHLRSAARGHLALVRAPPRTRGLDRRLRQLPCRHRLASDRAAPDRVDRLASYPHDDRTVLPRHDAAADARAAAALAGRASARCAERDGEHPRRRSACRRAPCRRCS